MIQVRPVESKGDLEHFLRFPWVIYHGDPCWVPPSLSQLRKRVDKHANPFLKYAEMELFAAYQDGEIVGTIAGIFNHQHAQQIGDQAGFFGFFETIPDREVAAALIDFASGWLKQKGVKRLRGPINGAPTDEVGVLIAGHDRSPSIWEGHSPPYYRVLLEDLGFEKYDDVFAYEITSQQFGNQLESLPPKLKRVARRCQASQNLVIRKTNKESWSQDILRVHDLYNTAFRTIPNHNDMSLEKFQQLVGSIRPLLDMDLMLIALLDGYPVGFAVAIPDFNEALRHFNGEIKPWQVPFFYWYLRGIRTACFKLLGVIPKYRGRGIEALLISEVAKHAVLKKYNRMEISLASEKNREMNQIIRNMGGNVYRQYRIYEREIE